MALKRAKRSAIQSLSVIICAYTMRRYDSLCAAIRSVQQQSSPATAIIVVVDHAPTLLAKVWATFPEIEVIDNSGERGLSGARNAGIAHATTDLIAFMDDDAEAEADWLQCLRDGLSDPEVMAVGGKIVPRWEEQAPRWFPDEFLWVVGSTYRGMPTKRAVIRNAIGANMAFRREVFSAIGGFRTGIGRVGTLPLGCEETELSIRAYAHWPARTIVYEPDAVVHHHVTNERTTLRYFARRCYAEGISKATITRFVGTQKSLASERAYTMRTLPMGVLRGLGALLRGDRAGGARAIAIILGLVITTLGYVIGKYTRSAIAVRTAAPVIGAITPQLGAVPIDADAADSKITIIATPNFYPRRIIETEISVPIAPIAAVDPSTGERYAFALSVIRLHGTTLGMVEVKLGEDGLTAEQYAQQIWQTVQGPIVDHLRHDGLPSIGRLTAEGVKLHDLPVCRYEMNQFLTDAPFASVIVTAHGDGAQLTQCLTALQALHYPRYEIIVADASHANTIRDITRSFNSGDVDTHYVAAPGRGRVATANNRAIAVASGTIIAFTDDAATVDTFWLANLVRAFDSAEQVAGVTGLVLPKEYETVSQQWMEEYGGYAKGFARKSFTRHSRHQRSALYPYNAGIFGTGISMAFTAEFLRTTGGFDPALDASSDLALFRTVITSGATLVYDPAALVYYQTPQSYTELVARIETYGAGLGAYIAQTFLSHPSVALRGLSKAPQGLYYLLSPWSSKNRKRSNWYPRQLLSIERGSMLRGALGYIIARIFTLRSTPRSRLMPPPDSDDPGRDTGPRRRATTAESTSLVAAPTLLHAPVAPNGPMYLLRSKFEEHRTMLLNGLSMIGTTGVTSLLGFLYWWAAARHFTPDAIGFASALVSVISLLGLLGMFGFGTMLIGELPRQPQRREPLISAALLFVAAVAGLGGLAFALIAPAFVAAFASLRANPGIVLLFTLGVSLSAVTLVLDQALIGLLLGVQQLWRNTIFATVKLGLLLGATYLIAPQGGIAIFATWVSGFVVSLLVLLVTGLLRGVITSASSRPDWARLRQLGGYAFQHHVLNSILLAANQLLPIIVTIMLSVRANAWFYLSFSLANLVFMIAYSLATALYAINAADSAGLTQRLRVTVLVSFIAVVGANVVVTFGASQILGIYGHAYAVEGAWSLRLLCLAAIPEIVRMHYVALQRIHNTMRAAMLPLAIGGVGEIALAALGAHLNGLSGLCAGWLIALSIQALYMSPAVVATLRGTARNSMLSDAASNDRGHFIDAPAADAVSHHIA